MKDLYANFKVDNIITPQAVGTSGIAGGKLSSVVDRRGYDSLMFVFSAGTSASAADTIVPVVYECATTGGTFTSVADADLNGLETAITLSESAARRIGYRGNKRYTKLRLYGVGHATGIVSAVSIKGDPHIGTIA